MALGFVRRRTLVCDRGACFRSSIIICRRTSRISRWPACYGQYGERLVAASSLYVAFGPPDHAEWNHHYVRRGAHYAALHARRHGHACLDVLDQRVLDILADP